MSLIGGQFEKKTNLTIRASTAKCVWLISIGSAY